MNSHILSEKEVLDILQKRYTDINRDFPFKSAYIAKKLNCRRSPDNQVTSKAVAGIMPILEEKGIVKKTSLARNVIVWKTCLENKVSQ
jgi:repressor of nif and glnA expression